MHETSVFNARRWAVAALVVVVLGTVSVLHHGGGWTASGQTLPGTPPEILCMWQLADMDASATSTQYGADHEHDFDMAQRPDADGDDSNGVQIPCEGPPDGQPNMPDGVKQTLQVKPVPGDDPGTRTFEVWLAATHPDGIDAIDGVSWTVSGPDGSEVAQPTGARIAAEDCATLGSSDAPADSSFHAAAHTGQLSEAAIDDVDNGLSSLCQGETAAMYAASFDLSHMDACGEYKLEAEVTATNDMTAGLSAYIDVLCGFFMEVETERVDWGEVTPGADSTVEGDLTWDDPPADQPTVRNLDNDGMELFLQFTEMTGPAEGAVIDEFSAAFGKAPDALRELSMGAGDRVSFGTDPGQVLCAGEMGRLDVTVLPPMPLPEGKYQGSLTVIGAHAPDIC
ncbi:MAG: hypothetical protein ACOC5M_03695 [Chloroflexota bacterium]